MPLIKTILDYFRKEHKPIIVGYEPMDCINKKGVICISRSKRKPEDYEGLYWILLHEFIHLDRKKTTGSYNGWGEKDGCNGINHPIERQIEREVGELITQNSMAYRVLKKQLSYATFLIAKSGREYIDSLEVDEDN
jgi:hypothetical protein